jgi:hypothetical protein
MYNVDFWPQSINGTGCVASGGTLAADLNAYWGNLVKTNAAFIAVGVGCACDGTNGQLAADNAYGAAMQQYLNGFATGGPTFNSTQQPLSNAWASWFFPGSTGLGQNPDGILQTNGSGNANVGQQQWWYSLLFNPATSGGTNTAWNPSDQLNMTLTNSNKTSTTTTSGTSAVRSTTSKTTGKLCEEFNPNLIAGTTAVGLANGTFGLGQTLGSNANGLAAVPNASTTQSLVYNGTTLTSHASTPSVNADAITMCEDLPNHLVWFTDAAMRAASGAGAWNNSGTCNPTVGACGLSFSGLTGPYLLAFNATGAQSASTTWNPADKATGITLSNVNQTATSAGSGSGSISVRTTSSKSSSKACVEATASTIGPNWTFGLTNATYSLTIPGGLGTDANGIGFNPNSTGRPQAVFFNNAAVSNGSSNSANGEAMTVCEDFGAKLLWVTSATMRAAGTPWNNSATANPATGTGGISTAALTCPCFATFNEINEVGVAVLNTAGPFAVTTPSGFTSWDSGTSSLPQTTLNTAGPFTVATPSGFVAWDATGASATTQVLAYPIGQ